MIRKRLPAKVTLVVIVLLSIFIFATVKLYTKKESHSTWKHYGGGPDQSRYFKGSEITKENVNQLKAAWVYPIMDSSFNFFSPIVVDSIMYVMAKNSSLVAVNAE